MTTADDVPCVPPLDPDSLLRYDLTVDLVGPCPLSPLEDRIVAIELPLPEIPPDAIWLPERTGGGHIRAEVVAVGPGRRTDSGELIPPPVVVGDVVVLAEHGPTEIDVDRVSYLCATPSLVLAVER